MQEMYLFNFVRVLLQVLNANCNVERGKLYILQRDCNYTWKLGTEEKKEKEF